jgi:CBS domain containing-hemolysin-like protein
MSEGRAEDDGPSHAPRTGLLTRVSSIFRGRREHSLRRSIEELMAEPGGEPQEEGGVERPELDRQERALIGNVLSLRGKTVDDVMVPRADIVAMAEDVTLDEALEVVRREGHSRLPIYREHLDEIVGMVHVKDLFAFVGRPQSFSIAAILREPLLVAPQVPVLDLLLQMRNVRTHLALVVDEYGGIDGLVSFEDLVETIVGDIADEHDEPEGDMLVRRADGTLDIDARLPVDEFEDSVGAVLTADERASEIETVGGLVFTLAGRVPTRGEVIGHPSGIEFRVIDSDPRHIRRLRASLPKTEAKVAGEVTVAGA